MMGSWSVAAEFVAGKNEWELISYTLDYAAARSSAQKEEPDIPHNPQAPTGGGNIGDTATNTMQVGNWSYTFSYTYGVRDGVLGWHLLSITATYKPVQRPVNQQQ